MDDADKAELESTARFLVTVVLVIVMACAYVFSSLMANTAKQAEADRAIVEIQRVTFCEMHPDHTLCRTKAAP